MPYVQQQSYRSVPKQPKKFQIVILVISLIIVAGLIGWFVFGRGSVEAPTQNSTIEQEANSAEKLQAKYLFSGTVVPARAVENEARQSDGSIDYDQPFSGLNTFNPEQYDEWIADLECPVTDTVIPYRQQVENTIFNCRPEFLPAMGKYFSIFNLANNHVWDLGRDKFPAMQDYIDKADIQQVGNYDASIKEDVCEVMAMKVSVHKQDGQAEKGTLPLAFCAWHYFMRDPYEGEFDVMHDYAEVMPVIGLMQVGAEYVAKAGADQEQIGRSIIDGGAEFVIGNSPHWVQNSDVYKNKLIFYSTGNFIFDQLDMETNRGASIEVNMTIDYDENVGQWLELGESCRVREDDCLEKARVQGLKKIQPKFTFGLVASTTGYQKITKKADTSTQNAVEQRANWLQTLRELGQQ